METTTEGRRTEAGEIALFDRDAGRFRGPAAAIAMVGMLVGLGLTIVGVPALVSGWFILLTQAGEAGRFDYIADDSIGWWLLSWAPGAVSHGFIFTLLSTILRWLIADPPMILMGPPVIGEIAER